MFPNNKFNKKIHSIILSCDWLLNFFSFSLCVWYFMLRDLTIIKPSLSIPHIYNTFILYTSIQNFIFIQSGNVDFDFISILCVMCMRHKYRKFRNGMKTEKLKRHCERIFMNIIFSNFQINEKLTPLDKKMQPFHFSVLRVDS